MYKLTTFILYSVFISIISIPVIVGCNNGGPKTKNTSVRSDTVRVWAIYRSALSGQADGGVVKRVHVVDTFSWKELSPGHMELKSGPDYYYLIGYNIPYQDSTGNQVKDSTGKVKVKFTEIPTDKKWVRNGFVNLDSAIKELNDLK